MKINQRLFVSYLLIIIVIMLGGFFSYKQFKTIKEESTVLHELHAMAKDTQYIAHDINAYLLSHKEHREEYEEHIKHFRKNWISFQRHQEKHREGLEKGKKFEDSVEKTQTEFGELILSLFEDFDHQQILWEAADSLGDQIDQEISRVSETTGNSSVKIQRLATLRQHMAYDTTAYLLGHKEHRQEFTEHSNDFQSILESIGIEGITALFFQYKKETNNLMNLYDQVLDIWEKVDTLGDLLDTEVEKLVEIHEKEVLFAGEMSIKIEILITLLTILISLLATYFLNKTIAGPVQALKESVEKIAEGNLEENVEINSEDEIGDLAMQFNKMREQIWQSSKEKEDQLWLVKAKANLSNKMRGARDIIELSKNILYCLSDFMKGEIGAIYLPQQDQSLKLLEGYALVDRQNSFNAFKLGEGLVGQAALEKKKIFISTETDDSSKINYGIEEQKPRNFFVMPVLFEQEVKAVITMGALHRFSEREKCFLEGVLPDIGIAFNLVQSSEKINDLLKETQGQTIVLKESEEKLQVINKELKRNSRSLEFQKEEIEDKNFKLEKSSREIEIKAQELEEANRYKSEFLANMSHELRTPLNSLLILAQELEGNYEGNLTKDQLESIEVIHSSGADLLNLINDILDLSKVEAGELDVHLEDYDLSELDSYIDRNFRHVARNKRIDFSIKVDAALPKHIRTDGQKVEQIIKNFISNAFKFVTFKDVPGKTRERVVSVTVGRPDSDITLNGRDPQKTIAVSVVDNGLGISPEKQKLIFEAFRQADGSTRRMYGGTGLGLSISAKLAELIGGEIVLKSEEGKGSCFTLLLPNDVKVNVNPLRGYAQEKKWDGVEGSSEIGHEFSPSREGLKGKKILIVDDDMRNIFSLAHVLKSQGIEVVMAENGQKALNILKECSDIDLVLMDIMMPVMDGYQAMKEIRKQERFRQLPVFALTAKAMKGDREKCIEAGASDYLTKPVEIEKLFSMLRVWLYSE